MFILCSHGKPPDFEKVYEPVLQQRRPPTIVEKALWIPEISASKPDLLSHPRTKYVCFHSFEISFL